MLQPEESLEQIWKTVGKKILPDYENIERTALGDSHKKKELLGEALPTEGMAFTPLLDELIQNHLSNNRFPRHPMFLGFVPGPSNFISMVGETLSAAFNIFAGNWWVGAGAQSLDYISIDWIKELLDLPEIWGGQFVSGGSMANLTALAAMREAKMPHPRSEYVLYCSDQTHSSVERCCKLLGFEQKQLRKVPSNAQFQIEVDALKQMIAEDRKSGLKPVAVVANAGTTNTGTVDPLDAIGQVCQAEHLWFHIDGAYGAAGYLTPEGKAQMKGLQMADSITLDPHKWWFQAFDCGVVLVKDFPNLKKTFSLYAEYLEDTKVSPDDFNFYDLGIELTRRLRSLKFYMTLKYFGVEKIRTAIGNGIHLGHYLQKKLEEEAEWEILSPAKLAILNFRWNPAGKSEEELDHLNQDLLKRLNNSGKVFLSSTRLHGIFCLRVCIIHPALTEKHMDELVQLLKELAGRQ